jgi:hypothetical protein
MEGMTSVVCALPYYFNLPMTKLAIEAGANFADLGGNTEIVEGQRKLDAKATAAGVSVIPDCGLAPGMVNILAQAGIDELDHTESVRMWVGGLPQNPEPPLNYQIVYSMEGVLDYYTTPGAGAQGGGAAGGGGAHGHGGVSDFPSPWGPSRPSTRRGGSRPCPSGTAGSSAPWSTRPSATPGTRRS